MRHSYHMDNSKRHAGRIASLEAANGSEIIVYVAGKQSFDVGTKYAVACDHGSVVGASTEIEALDRMHESHIWCRGCELAKRFGTRPASVPAK
jgi:hypothetical protein